MKTLKQLIDRYCPNGVEYVRLGDVVTIKNGSDWKRQEPGDIAVYGSGGKMLPTVKTPASSEPSVLLPRKGTLEVQFVNVPFWNIDTAFRTETNPSRLSMKYFYYSMKGFDFSEISTSATRPSLTQTALKSLKLPLPPREIQDKIVEHLDTFAALCENLDLEISQREKQFAEYREKMLSADYLTSRYCPEGVEYVRLEEVVGYEQPAKYLVKDTDYDDSFETPVLTAGKTFLLGYTDETDGIYKATPANPVVIFDDFTTASKWVNFPFKAKSSAMKLLTPKDDTASLRFVFLAMYDVEVDTTDHKRQWIRTFSKELIPLPPREVQDKIVAKLDAMQELIDNLRLEREQRQQQFDYYREKLLSFSKKETTEV